MSECRFGPLTLAPMGQEILEIIACEKDAAEVEIPAMVNGRAVKKIGDYAFRDCAALRRVSFCEPTLEELLADCGLYELGAHAFMGCSSLTEIELPWELSMVGWGCFHSCTALWRVECSPNTYFSGYAFANCRSLREITPLSSLSEGIFSHCMSLTQLPLDGECHTIDEDAFEHCEGLTEIIIPESVTRIEALAFRGCYDLKRVTFSHPDGWVFSNRYREGVAPLDLSDPERNAIALSRMDFDDGVIAWTRDKA